MPSVKIGASCSPTLKRYISLHKLLALNKKKERLLLIFTRNPEFGKCKTRLAAKIGDRTALEIYQFLLKHTAEITRELEASKAVYYSEEIWNMDVWDNALFSKYLQNGTTLGERMRTAFKTGFNAGFKKIIVIGSDMYDLNTQDLDMAFDNLDENDYVIGPATDGGYYLFGMKDINHDVFQNKEWGTESVLESTLEDLMDEKVKLLDYRNDVDTYDDIKDIEVFQHFLND